MAEVLVVVVEGVGVELVFDTLVFSGVDHQLELFVSARVRRTVEALSRTRSTRWRTAILSVTEPLQRLTMFVMCSPELISDAALSCQLCEYVQCTGQQSVAQGCV